MFIKQKKNSNEALSGSVYAVILFWILGKLPFPSHLVTYFIKIGKVSAKIPEIGKIKAMFGLGMTPIQGRKNGPI